MAIRVHIEGYDSLEQIGIGGMAAVYKARKISIDKTVAVKVLFPYLATDASFIERFQREAKAAASIQHENIVNVIDFGESEGSFYIVMEYYQGRTLEDLMKERAGIPLEVAAQIILEVAYGLEAAHHLDIVHRDIKPANIIFTNQGGIKVADFGLAKKSDSMTMITQQGKVIGTPAYMSPEQAAGRAVGTASDVFSLGVVAYELFGRRKPFEGKTYSEVLEKIQSHRPASVTQVNPVVGPEFAAVVGRMLEKSDRDRYANATTVIAEMEAAMEKAKITRDRRRLASYIKDPDGYDAASTEKTIAQCLSRGTFFLQKGQHHLDDAELEFRRILFLDPNNDRARKNLDRIKSQQSSANRTITIDAAASLEKPAAATTDSMTARERPSRRKWGVRGAGVTAAIVVLVTAWMVTRTPTRLAPSEAEPAPASMVDRSLANPSTSDQAGAVATKAPGDSIQNMPKTATGLREPERAANATAQKGVSGTSGKTPDVAATKPNPTPSKPSTVLHNEPKRTRTVSEKSTERQDIASTGTKPAVEKPAGGTAKTEGTQTSVPPVVKPPDGTLSVFYLGGVGEFFVNGKRFAHQPPFEKVNMPAGTYRMACRMSGDSAPKEIVVMIRSNEETVIEYEIGRAPVVTSE